ncbi:MAG TPA: aspartate--tRNA ligase [Euryarchaeota archaeon]|nr:aspartate--tRNA ligase [Euryarchaeota archaeon]
MMRTHTCGEIRSSDIGKEVILAGWARLVRDHGGILFIDLADRYGTSQVVFDPECYESKDVQGRIQTSIETVGREYVLKVKGVVRKRVEGTEDARNPTGEVEVLIAEIEILNTAEVPPFELIDQKETLLANEDVRMEYRYLDLRRSKMIANLTIRNRIASVVRGYLWERDFLEIETPILVRSTPEGARDFLVPSRHNPGMFYALPQSPQLYKQLLMIGSADKYFQLARCFRDEDARADRQPEFTQIDLEMSFVDEEDIISLVEGMIVEIWRSIRGVEPKHPFRRMSYHEAMETYGTDAPDLRYDLPIIDVTDICRDSEYSIFQAIIKSGGKVRCINAKQIFSTDPNVPEDQGKFGRNWIDRLIDWTKDQGAKGLTWMKVIGNKVESNIVKYFGEKVQERLVNAMEGEQGDLLLFVADSPNRSSELAGRLREKLAQEMELIQPDRDEFVWIVDFPLFDIPTPGSRPQAMHHPFTSPEEQTVEYLGGDVSKLRSRGYDIVLNGVELGGGSIRIHRPEVQRKVLNILGVSEREAEEKFGFLLRALKYGAPPHGGIAIGFDRLVAVLLGIDTIKEVMSFPKNKKFQSLTDGSPSYVDEKQLKELQLLSLASPEKED